MATDYFKKASQPNYPVERAIDRAKIIHNPMAFVSIGSENAHLQKSNPKLYNKLMKQAKAEKKKLKAEFKASLR